MDAVETLRSWLTSSCETLSIILNQGAYPGPLTSRNLSAEELERLGMEALNYPLVLTGVEGQMTLVLPQTDGARLADLLVGGDGHPDSDELTELHLNVLMEAINQLTGTLSDILSSVHGRTVKVRTGEPARGRPDSPGGQSFVWIDLPLELDDGNKLALAMLMPSLMAERLVPKAPEPEMPTPPKVHQAAKFEPVEAAAAKPASSRLDLILDVPLQVQVVLGRTSVMVNELMNLGEGSVLELDRLAGEPVELYVHDRLVAYAEVVVVDERFGVKILDLAQEQRQKGRSTIVC